MLILEGPDMVGKTTIARAISDAVPRAKYDKFGLPEAEYQGLAPWLRRAGPANVCDRYWISEFIYGLVCRGRSNISPEMHQTMILAMDAIQARVQLIVCKPMEYSLLIQKRYDPAREAFTRSQCEQVNEAYWELACNRMWRGYVGGYSHAFQVSVLPDGTVKNVDSGYVRSMVGEWTSGIDGRAAWFEYGGMAQRVQPILDQYGETL